MSVVRMEVRALSWVSLPIFVMTIKRASALIIMEYNALKEWETSITMLGKSISMMMTENSGTAKVFSFFTCYRSKS